MKRGMLVAIVMAGALAGAAPAGASTLVGSYFPSGGSCCESRAIFSYVGSAGEYNDVTVSHNTVRWPLPRTVGFNERGGLITASPTAIIDPTAIGGPSLIGLACVPGGIFVACVTQARVVQVGVQLGDLADRATAAAAQDEPGDCGVSPCFSISWDGGAGDDTIIGSIGFDSVNGGDGDDILSPNRGADRISGGSGNDHVLVADDGVVDLISCGAGSDLVTHYSPDPLDVIDADCETAT